MHGRRGPMRAGRCLVLLLSSLAVPAHAVDSNGVLPGADIGVAVTAPEVFVPGTTAYAVVLVVNFGPEASDGVNLDLIFPVGLNLVSTTGPCTSWPCSVGTLGAGALAAITMRFEIPASYTVPDPAVVFVMATATTPDPVEDNNGADAVVDVQPQADMELELTGPPGATPPHVRTYTWKVTHHGTSDAARARLLDPTPPGLTFVGVGGACSGTLPCFLGTLPAGETRTATVRFALPATYSGPDPIHNSGLVDSETSDLNPAN